MKLWPLFWNHSGRLIHKPKHYIPIYERFFADRVSKPLTFFEIGCGYGGSMQMWKSYFGPHARIIGLDIRSECKSYEDDQISVRIGSQSDPQFLASVVEEFGPPDIVNDDGSHFMRDVIASFEFLYDRMAKDGIYLVEDMYFAYRPTMGGGLGAPNSFIEYSKRLVDQLHARYTNGALFANSFTENTIAIHFYDGIVVFERGLHPEMVDLHRGVAPPKPPKETTTAKA